MIPQRASQEPAARILIVEDSPTQAAQLEFILQERGYTVLTAKNGVQALAVARQQPPPDLIISDIMMPEMDGYALCRAIKGDPAMRETPFVLVTELSSPQNVFTGLDAGADNFIVKPYSDDVLISRITYLLTNRNLRKSGKLQIGVEIELSGQRHFITAERQQILDLLISTYDQAVHLYDELDARQKELSVSYDTLNVLYEMAEGLNRCRTEPDVAACVADIGVRLPGIRATWVYLREGSNFVLQAANGVSLVAADTAIPATAFDRCLSPRGTDNPKFHLAVALAAADETLGAANFLADETRPFSDDQRRMLSSIGNQIASSLVRARQHQNLQHQVQKRTSELRAETAERRAAEELVRASGETIQAILNSSPTAIVTIGADRKVLTWNRAAEEIFGYSAEDAYAGLADGIVPTDRRAELDDIIAEAEAGNVVRQLETRRLHKDGRALEVRLSAAALHDNTGRFRGCIFGMEDMSDRKRLEQQLHHSQKMEAIGSLTGGIAHDFNNLLTIIIGNLDLMEGMLPEHGEVRSLLKDAVDAGSRGTDLTRQLLVFGRRQALEPTVVEVNALISGMVKLLRRSLGESIRIVFTEGNAVWPVLIDSAQLDSAIVNLAVNARDAMPEGGTLVIETRNQHIDDSYKWHRVDMAPGDYVVVEVTDTGAGIAPDVLNRIFEPFFTTKEMGKGTGLGLAMVYGFVKQSGGHISVYSEVGHGTTFRLYLPRAAQVADVKEQGNGRAEAPARTGGETVLMVEDNPAVRSVVHRQLLQLGYKVLSAENAANALAVLTGDEKIDLMFSDIVMPGNMSGIELAEEVRKRWPDIKIVLTSGFPETTVGGKVDPSGWSILSKPYRQAELAKRLRQELDA